MPPRPLLASAPLPSEDGLHLDAGVHVVHGSCLGQNALAGVQFDLHQLHIVTEDLIVDDIGAGEDDAVFLHLVGTEDGLLALLHGGRRHGCALLGTAVSAEAAAVGKLITTIHTKCHNDVPPLF